MIDFNEELKKFTESLEVSSIERELLKDDKDVSEIILEILRKER